VIRSFTSEWIRFRKTARIGILVMVFFMAMISMFLFIGDEGFGPGGDDGGPGPDFGADLTDSDGAVAALSTAVNMIGVVSLALFAISVARDFELGTIRNLLVGEPRRVVLLAGKLLAVAAYVVVGVAIASVFAAVLAFVLAPSQDVSTDAWALSASLGTVGTVAATGLLFGLLGAAIAMVTRSAAISITTGVAYLLIVENLLGLIWDAAGEWLPAGVFEAFAQGGTPSVSFEKSAALATAYAAAALNTLFVIFTRRDVTD
jgi:ABC-type transport system involved in multi-copper enzyme maturation permease subunit